MFQWTEEELREMAAADAQIDADTAVDPDVAKAVRRALGHREYKDAKEYYRVNRDRIRAYQKQYYQDNRERILKQRQKRYRNDEKFREANNARSKAWYYKHVRKKEGDAI